METKNTNEVHRKMDNIINNIASKSVEENDIDGFLNHSIKNFLESYKVELGLIEESLSDVINEFKKRGIEPKLIEKFYKSFKHELEIFKSTADLIK